MALNNETIAAVLAAIADSDQDAVTQQIKTAYVASKVAETTTALAPAVTLTVTNWPAVDSMLAATTSSQTLLPLRAAIQAKIAAEDDDNLGVLLLMLYAATSRHFG